jgi:alkylhydroperoxidase/carboxymuconolactone decarboxylase family protein YurZ
VNYGEFRHDVQTDSASQNPAIGAAPSAAEVRRRLDEFRKRRGYLMAHQGVMAAALPELQDAYGPFYKVLTLDPHHLTPLEREFVWLALLIAAREHIGTHHVDLFFKSGGTEAQAEAAFRLAAWSAGVSAYTFLDEHWQGHFPAVDAHCAYRDGVSALMDRCTEVTPTMARLALVTVHTARRDPWGVAAEIVACYSAGIPEVKVAEAMSLALWPCGVNAFLAASEVWLALIREGKVQPSEPFRVWADTPGQDGLDLPPRDG